MTETKIEILPFDMSKHKEEIENNNSIIDALVEENYERVDAIAQKLGYLSSETAVLTICLVLADRSCQQTNQPFWYTSDELVKKIDTIGWYKVKRSIVKFIDERCKSRQFTL